MDYSNRDMPIFNAVIAKKNLLREMDKLGVKQKDIVSITGNAQPEVSKKLNVENEDYKDYFFRTEELFKICYALGISMDEITGLKEIQNKGNSASLSNACGALCDLHRVMPLIVNNIELETIDKQTAETIKKKRPVLLSKYEECDSMIKEFEKVSSINLEMLSLWENNYKEKHNKQLRKYGFRSYAQYICTWLNNWITELRDNSIGIYNARIDSSNYHALDIAHKSGIAFGESVYSVFEQRLDKNDIQKMYEQVDNYIIFKNYPPSSVEHISLELFKEIYESKNTID